MKKNPELAEKFTNAKGDTESLKRLLVPYLDGLTIEEFLKEIQITKNKFEEMDSDDLSKVSGGRIDKNAAKNFSVDIVQALFGLTEEGAAEEVGIDAVQAVFDLASKSAVTALKGGGEKEISNLFSKDASDSGGKLLKKLGNFKGKK